MEQNEKFCWTIIGMVVLSLLDEGVEGIFDPYPLNAAVTAGSSVTLYCVSSSNTYSSSWLFTAYNGTGAGTIGNCLCSNVTCTNGNPFYFGYQLLMPTPQTCNLQMSSIQLYQAGQYSCTSSGPGDLLVSALLAVVDSHSSCLRNFSSNAIPQDSTIQMIATDSCYGCNQYFVPNITWTPITSGSPPSNSFTNTSFTSALTSEKAQAPSTPSYYMTLSFTALATGAPPVTATNTNFSSFQLCSYSSVLVAYPPYPNNISIMGATNGSDVLQYTVLTCTAATYQGATFMYLWTGPGGSFPSGQTLIIPENGTLTYTCTATDTLSGVGSGSNSITLNITFVPITTSPTTTPSTTPFQGPASLSIGAIIAIAVCGGCGAIIAIILLICCFYPSCKLYPVCRESGPKAAIKGNGPGSTTSSRADIPRSVQPPDDYTEDYHRTSPVMNNSGYKDETGISLESYPPTSPYDPPISPDQLVYAELKVDNRPRSRNPIQSPAPTEEDDSTNMYGRVRYS